jgi:ABC-type antimicrobial peptide transport system permease subunit
LRELATDLDAGAIVDLPRAVSDENAELAGTRFITGMLTVFAGVAVFLAMLGMYAVTAYAVQQRERELAIRVALGATHRALTRLFLRDGGVVIALGLVAGVAGALFAGRMLEARLPSVQTPASLAAAAAVIVIAGTLAIGGPARRASVRQPASLLKNE